MNKPTLGRDRAIDFQATPMIDVVFLLIIFFLVSSHLASQETPTSVDLPRASLVEPPSTESPTKATIDVTAEGDLLWDRQTMTIEQVAQRLSASRGAQQQQQTAVVRIRADRKTRYERIETLLLACQQAGIQEVAFAVIEGPQNSTVP